MGRKNGASTLFNTVLISSIIIAFKFSVSLPVEMREIYSISLGDTIICFTCICSACVVQKPAVLYGTAPQVVNLSYPIHTWYPKKTASIYLNY